MTIKVGLDSTKILLTEKGKEWFLEAYPQGIVYEYEEDGIFRLNSMMVVDSQAIATIICPMGIPYRIPANIDGQTTFKMTDREEAEGYFKQMTPFFRAMAQTMAKAHKEKGASWKTCSIGYLLDRASNQFEDLGNRPGEEDYMANLANYAYMLWRHEQAAQDKIPLDFGEAEG